MSNDKIHSDSFTEPEDFDYDPIDNDDDVADGVDSQSESKTPRRRHRFRKFMLWFAFIVILILGVAFWIRYMNPYSVGTHERGYIVGLECKGILFKTWEGEMIGQKALTDTVNIYSHSRLFSVENAEVARRLDEYNGTGRQVVVTFDRYMGALPWRGSQTCIVTNVEPVD